MVSFALGERTESGGRWTHVLRNERCGELSRPLFCEGGAYVGEALHFVIVLVRGTSILSTATTEKGLALLSLCGVVVVSCGVDGARCLRGGVFSCRTRQQRGSCKGGDNSVIKRHAPGKECAEGLCCLRGDERVSRRGTLRSCRYCRRRRALEKVQARRVMLFLRAMHV
jgi:hypothetical protein